MKPSVALQMIVKDEVEQVATLVLDAAAYLDAANITVTTPKAYKRLSDVFKDEPKIKVSFFEWANDFAAARNFNLEQCQSDYFFWVDADDEFDFSTVPELLQIAVDGNYELIYLPYVYAQDNLGNTVVEHYRERLIKNNAGFEWRGVVHENLLRDTPFRAKKLKQPVVIHHAGDPEASKLRNHQILQAQVEGKPHDEVDPRNLHYLGISYFSLGDYRKAIETLLWYVEVGGWDEEIYRSFIKISEAYFMLDDVASATEFAHKAMALLPHYPDSYFTLARFSFALEQWADCLEWLEVAFSKPKPETMSIQNPQIWDMGKLQAATCLFQLRQFGKAYKYLQTVPEYLAADQLETFRYEANKEMICNLIPDLINKGFADAQKLYAALAPDLKYDTRLRGLRNQVVEAVSWPENSIVFFCGAGYEEWGAHTLSKGMGGSEEAVVYLSREFAKRGYDVTVYNSVEQPVLDQFDPAVHKWVQYKPWREFDTRDQFDTLVLWRQPQAGDNLNARVKIIDMHDVLPPQAVPEHEDATYFVKSKWQRDLYPKMPDNQFHVIGNGIVTDQFKDKDITKRPHSVGYFSAYYRGLECLIDMWPKIREQVPDATLDIAYGWGSWVAFQGEDEFYHRMNAKLKAIGARHEGAEYDPDNDNGVIMHDRLSHDNLAKLMLATQVWAYPTQFPETHCITALKAQEALCYPVTTNVAALAETVTSGEKLDTEIIYSNEYEQAKFIAAVVAALKEEKTGKPFATADWSYVADDWIKFIEEQKS